MYAFLEQNALYVVLLITLTVWLGIAAYMQSIEKKLRAAEQKLAENVAPESLH
jgi:hypothetical protein